MLKGSTCKLASPLCFGYGLIVLNEKLQKSDILKSKDGRPHMFTAKGKDASRELTK